MDYEELILMNAECYDGDDGGVYEDCTYCEFRNQCMEVHTSRNPVIFRMMEAAGMIPDA